MTIGITDLAPFLYAFSSLKLISDFLKCFLRKTSHLTPFSLLLLSALENENYAKCQLKTAIGRAISRNDVVTIRDALEVSAEIYKKDANNVPDYIQRHLLSISIWEELRYSLTVITLGCLSLKKCMYNLFHVISYQFLSFPCFTIWMKILGSGINMQLMHAASYIHSI